MTTTADTDRKLVLQMLAEGKISVDDAERLLAKLEEVESRPQDNGGAAAPARKRPKHLRIVATDGSAEDAIDLQIPLGLVRAGLALDSFLPKWAQSRIYVAAGLSEATRLDNDFLRENLDELDVSFDSDDGENVRIFVE